ncbi:MAG: hypothetical protein IKR80_07490 [Spirochaetales bacterium]|nr:hypothetical protein [Spirochaetales bacterium]
MEKDRLHDFCDYLIPRVREAFRKAPLKEQKGRIEYKELNDVATETDNYMEKEIIRIIREVFPDHRFIGEEYGATDNASPYEWLIDPVDGTVNYAAGIPMYGTSVALRENGETVFGVIFDWPGNSVYYAFRGEGAFCNGERLAVSAKREMRDSIATICLTSSYDGKLTDRVLGIVRKLQPHVRGIRIIVCTVYELIWLARGWSECMINIKPSIGVGSCAGKLIVTEAGGKVTNTKGEKRREIDDLLITNGLLHDEFLKLVKEALDQTD